MKREDGASSPAVAQREYELAETIAIGEKTAGRPAVVGQERSKGKSGASGVVRPSTAIGSIEGFSPARGRADTRSMIWPAAALAVLLLGFVVVYGSVLQARVETGIARALRNELSGETERA